MTKFLNAMTFLVGLLDKLVAYISNLKEKRAREASEYVRRDVARGVDVRLSDDGFRRD